MKIKFFLLFLAISLFIVACSDDNTTTPPDPPEKNEYKIGVLIPLTGAGELNGAQSKKAVEYAIKDINTYFSTQSINTVIKGIYKDSGTDTTQALKMIRQFADSGVKIVVGPYSSTTLAYIKPFADSASIMLVSHSAVASSLGIKDDNIFRMAPSDVWQGKALGKIMEKDGKLVTIPLIRDDVWGRGLYTDIKDALETSAISLQVPYFYPPDQTNFSALVQKIKIDITNLQNTFLDEEICVLMVSYSEGTEILRQCSFFEEFNNIKFYGASAYSNNNTLIKNGTAAGMAMTTNLECPIMGFDEGSRNTFLPLYERLSIDLLREPDIYAFTIYDAAFLAGLTMNSVGNETDIQTIMDRFLTTSAVYKGMTGNVEFDHNDDRINVLYDFWGVKDKGTAYEWTTTAAYNTETGEIIRK